MRGGGGQEESSFSIPFFSLSLSLPLSLPLFLRFSRLLDISRVREVGRGVGRGRRKREKEKEKNGVLVAWLELAAVLAAGARQIARYVECQLNGG